MIFALYGHFFTWFLNMNSPTKQCFLVKKESCLFLCYIYIGALDIQTSVVWSFLIVEIRAIDLRYFRFLDILTVAEPPDIMRLVCQKLFEHR